VPVCHASGCWEKEYNVLNKITWYSQYFKKSTRETHFGIGKVLSMDKIEGEACVRLIHAALPYFCDDDFG
jgi:hypothetical protein